MIWARRIAMAVIAVVLVLALVGLVLPREVHVERSIVIAAEPAAVFPYVNDLRRFNAWSPWSRRDPNMETRFDGPDAGVGQRMSWTSDKPDVGSGSQEIIESVDGTHVCTALIFGSEEGMTAEFDLSRVPGGTKVVWSFETDLGWNPFSRYVGLMFDGLIGKDYEEGLANLKTAVESGA
ncbi:MAG: SRPBCC family protein [Alphaproteobacteria bacterium]|nr:SRPBCC family protein [Alphaproteobacteria bacterium]